MANILVERTDIVTAATSSHSNSVEYIGLDYHFQNRSVEPVGLD